MVLRTPWLSVGTDDRCRARRPDEADRQHQQTRDGHAKHRPAEACETIPWPVIPRALSPERRSSHHRGHSEHAVDETADYERQDPVLARPRDPVDRGADGAEAHQLEHGDKDQR